jgi:hypothetical protein
VDVLWMPWPFSALHCLIGYWPRLALDLDGEHELAMKESVQPEESSKGKE